MKEQCNSAEKQSSKLHKLYQDTISDCMVLEECIEDIQEENIQLSKALVLVQREISTHHRQQRPICEIIKELSEFINETVINYFKIQVP